MAEIAAAATVSTKLFLSLGTKEVQAWEKLPQFQSRGGCQDVSRLISMGCFRAVISIM